MRVSSFAGFQHAIPRPALVASLASLLCVATALAGGMPGRDASGEAARQGVAAPDCTWMPLDDTRPLAMRQLRGKVVYVDFWASWCRSCAASFPFLNEMDRELRDRGLQVVGVNLDEDPLDARGFLSEHPAGFPIATGFNQQCAREFGVAAMPTAYVVDRDGIIRDVHVGFRPGEAKRLRATLEALLEESPAGR